MVLINILGFLCLIIGIFATVPTTMMAIAAVYRNLLKQTQFEGGEPVPASPPSAPAPEKIKKGESK
jgi:predicted cobalt transporter CbtA